MKKLTALLTLVSLLVQLGPFRIAPALAAGPTGGLLLPGEASGSTGSEFVSGNYPGAILMPVNLWGAVIKPGIHHVPTQTDLVTLLSLAGGPTGEARLDRISIKRRSGSQEQILRVDAEDILDEPGVRSPVLEANDIIIVPRDQPTVSNNTMSTVSFLGSILGIILAGYALSRPAR
ncbi:MAG: SLBB domain-containing protein [Oligoflexia bacterium]|nr:SLBB domain-containing protein [Oligoflexia bacterium]